MPLHDVVMPAITNALKPLEAQGATPAIAGITLGFPAAIPGSPYVVLMNGNDTFPPRTGSDLEVSDWVVHIMLFCDVNTDSANSEVVLTSLIEPIRSIFRTHVQLGQPTIARTFISGARWSYMNVNGIDYRTVTLVCECREKIPTSSGA